MAKTPLSYNEQAFVRAALTAGQRVDGRGLLEMRRVKISFPADTGTAEVQMGSTRVVAVVTADLAEPVPERATEGFFVFSAELNSMCSERFREGERGTRAASLALSRLLERTLRDSGALDVESLCVVAGVSVWSVRVDVHVLDHDGNLSSACCLAAAAALQHFRRPEVLVESSRVHVVPPSEREPLPLALHHVPLVVTFALYDDAAGSVLVDPSAKEEATQDAELVIAANSAKEIACVNKAGGAPIAPATLRRCADIATEVAASLNATLTAALESERKRRQAKYRAAGGARPERYQIGAVGEAPPGGASAAPPARADGADETAARADAFANDLDALLRSSSAPMDMA